MLPEEQLSTKNASNLHAPSNFLSELEYKVLLNDARGRTAAETSEILNLSEHTISLVFACLWKKLQVESNSQAIAKAFALGLLSHSDILGDELCFS